ncbi:MerR family transcriptional regulator [Streptomyces sp. KS 21]|uniref:DNA polymerase III subunit beta family protein n=1 Tax=Streptomyces sp. KS 21 TaxID=2485150 RepID=UPI0010D6CB2F|nr:MerR family transcriptional regulator [Streptomyces sp. KS 21]TDU74412.1 DNA polymerase III beta subunit-like protein [Streptomyces sp. KS 21]
MDDTRDTRDTPPDLMTISAFARRVGLAPSALRFYDDCRVLLPAHVDPLTGYRHYTAAQEPRAALLRDLRAAGLALADVVAVLDGPAEGARQVLERHRAAVRERGRAADEAIRAVLGGLPGGPGVTEFTLGGAELASAARQVAPAAGRDPGHPVLGCVLVEFEEDEVRFVATDRYRFALRTLRPSALTGPPGRFLIEADALVALGAWAARAAEVTVTAGPEGSGIPFTIRHPGGSRDVVPADGAFPAYREMLAALEGPAHRVVVDRAALIAALDTCGADVPAVAVELGRDRLLVSRPDTGVCAARLAAVREEAEPVRIGFDPAVLAPALEAAVGPDVLLEISFAPARPVLVRSADQGSFTTLVMPVALPARPAGGGRAP